MNNLLKQYWYIIAESRDLKKNQILARQLLDEWLVMFRGQDNKPCVMRDKCLHRCARLSKGQVLDGLLTCPYHGWVYNGNGQLVSVPAHFGRKLAENGAQSHAFPCIEQDGYIYVSLSHTPATSLPPRMFATNNPQSKKIRLVNKINNSLVNCVENFIDIPHTAFVHKGIFRNKRNQKVTASVTRENGHLQINYQNESNNLGSFSWLLNPKGKAIFHQDNFYAPNITHVIYRLEKQWEYTITSQTIPVTSDKSIIYTEINYHFGAWTRLPFMPWLIRRQAQRVIDQDVDILNQQMEVIQKYGQQFCATSADLIHTLTSEIIEALSRGQDLASLPNQQQEIVFWV